MSKHFTADNTTDDEIRALHAVLTVLKPRSVGDSMCCIALGIPLWTETSYGDPMNWSFDPTDPEVRARARHHCARMLHALSEFYCCNAHTTEVKP